MKSTTAFTRAAYGPCFSTKRMLTISTTKAMSPTT
jgi:hypothetical protein